jgi:hypothetical protein
VCSLQILPFLCLPVPGVCRALEAEELNNHIQIRARFAARTEVGPRSRPFSRAIIRARHPQPKRLGRGTLFLCFPIYRGVHVGPLPPPLLASNRSNTPSRQPPRCPRMESQGDPPFRAVPPVAGALPCPAPPRAHMWKERHVVVDRGRRTGQ